MRTTGKQYGLSATGDYQPSLRSPLLAAYVDRHLKYHGLIQAFSRTNRVLHGAKPCGNILDFRDQRKAVDDAIALFSGEAGERAREIWLVDRKRQRISPLAAY